MCSSDAIKLSSVGKRYEIYDRPKDRLLQMLYRGRKRFYREFWALNDVSFKITKGETVGIIGRNGSGKSTLLQAICGTVQPTVGTLTTMGRIAALLELGAGFNPEFSGLENIMLNGAILGISPKEMERRIEDIVAFSELGEFIHQPVKTYSSGMQARLGFSVAINVDPEILIIDEALAVGDARFVAKCMHRIRDIQNSGATILFVSHDVTAVRTLCDRAIWIHEGKLVEDGDVFPVTGRFMEFMLDGEKDNVDLNRGAAVLNSRGDVAMSVVKYDSKPVTHWGSHVGCIQSAGLFDHQGNRRESFQLGQEVEARIEVNLSNRIERQKLAVAFSIKDLKGNDLIVASTADREWFRFEAESGKKFVVKFRFKNPLTTGNFLMVAAVEDRSSATFQYYEYLEGAHYFSSIADEQLFGVFHPEIKREVSDAHERI